MDRYILRFLTFSHVIIVHRSLQTKKRENRNNRKLFEGKFSWGPTHLFNQNSLWTIKFILESPEDSKKLNARRLILADLFWAIYTFRNHVLIRLMNFRKLHFDPIFPQLSKTCFQNEEDIIFTATYACSKKIRFRNSFRKKSIMGYANSANRYQTISQTFYRFPLKIE